MISKELKCLAVIFDGYKKRKLKVLFKSHNCSFILFIKYLTLHKLIYGFRIFSIRNEVSLFLKYPVNNQTQPIFKVSKCTVPRGYFSSWLLVKKTLYNRNTHYIYITRLGYLSATDLIKLKQGGKLLLVF